MKYAFTFANLGNLADLISTNTALHYNTYLYETNPYMSGLITTWYGALFKLIGVAGILGVYYYFGLKNKILYHTFNIGFILVGLWFFYISIHNLLLI